MCHNLYLGLLVQSLSEVTALAEDFLSLFAVEAASSGLDPRLLER